MDKSEGLVIDMVDVPFSPTAEELKMVEAVQEKLNDLQQKNNNSSESVRKALTEYSKNIDFLLVFIRGRKLNLRKTVDSIKRYAEVRYDKYPELFPDQVPDYVRYIIKHRLLDALRRRDHLGRVVAIVNFEKWDHRKISLDDLLVAARFIFEFGMKLPETLVTGFAMLFNCSGAGFQHMKQFTLPTILKVVNTFVLAYPYPLKGIYVINAPILVKPIFAMARPFLPAKLSSRVMITSGVKELQHHISPVLLPESLGGTLSEDEALSMDYFQLPN